MATSDQWYLLDSYCIVRVEHHMIGREWESLYKGKIEMIDNGVSRWIDAFFDLSH